MSEERDKAISDLTEELCVLVSSYIDEYDMSLGDILSCFSSAKQKCCKEYSYETKNE